MHGVTKQERWEARATLRGDTIAASTNTTFDMADYDIEPPTVGPVLSIDETIVLEIDLVANRA